MISALVSSNGGPNLVMVALLECSISGGVVIVTNVSQEGEGDAARNQITFKRRTNRR